MNKRVVRFALGALAAGTLGLLGCGSDSTTGGTPDAPVASGTYTHYVTSSAKVGASASEATALAFDLDGDAAGKKDNALGILLAGLKSANILDVDKALGDSLTAGEFIILHSVRAANLTGPTSATWQVYIADAKASPDLTSGNGAFTVAAASPRDAIITGTITGGVFTGGPATVTLQLTLVSGSPPLTLTLVGARLEAQVTATGCMSGRLGGGIKKTDIDTLVVPAIADILNGRINADGTCKTNYASCSTANKSILDLLDRQGTGNMDNQIQVGEITSNPLLAGALKADVDLLDATGKLGKDGIAESNSIALGFNCVKGIYTATNEK